MEFRVGEKGQEGRLFSTFNSNMNVASGLEKNYFNLNRVKNINF